MAVQCVPVRRSYHLRVLATSLALVVFCLAGFLFGVNMEAIVPATGTITARDLHEVRSLVFGLIEPGWHEAEVARPGSRPVVVRMDAQGDGVADPSTGKVLTVQHHKLVGDSQEAVVKEVRFHRLQVGDELWAGQVVAAIRTDEWRSQLNHLDNRIKELESRGDSTAEQRRERDRLREQLSQAVLHVPTTAARWLVLEVQASPLQAVQAGAVIATIVPVDPDTHQPRDLVARLDVDEKHFGDLQKDQTVRIYSTMYNHRLHGWAEAQIDKLEPLGEPTANSERRFHAQAPISQAPFALAIGSTFKAEIVVGRKLVYRIILEH